MMKGGKGRHTDTAQQKQQQHLQAAEEEQAVFKLRLTDEAGRSGVSESCVRAKFNPARLMQGVATAGSVYCAQGAPCDCA